MIKIVHTSDWHLGKKLFRLDRSEEHTLFLNWLLQLIKKEQIDLLLIAGDIFDTPNPPHTALEMYFRFLHQISIETNCEVQIISGNHDSGALIEAPKTLLQFHRVHVTGKLSQKTEDHWRTFKKGQLEVEICAIPFFRSYELIGNDDNLLTSLKKYFYSDSMNHKILLLHHLAGKFETTGSEHLISLSGIESIPPEILDHFSYVALGHIHKHQKIASNAFYSGSPIPMRFSEKSQKMINLITIDDKNIEISSTPIPIFRELFKLNLQEANWKEEINNIKSKLELKAIAEVEITLSSPQTGLADEIRSILDSKNIELLSFSTHLPQDEASEEISNPVYQLGPIDLFKEFYKNKYPQGTGPEEEIINDFKNILEKSKDENFKT